MVWINAYKGDGYYLKVMAVFYWKDTGAEKGLAKRDLVA